MFLCYLLISLQTVNLFHLFDVILVSFSFILASVWSFEVILYLFFHIVNLCHHFWGVFLRFFLAFCGFCDGFVFLFVVCLHNFLIIGCHLSFCNSSGSFSVCFCSLVSRLLLFFIPLLYLFELFYALWGFACATVCFRVFSWLFYSSVIVLHLFVVIMCLFCKC